MRYTRARRKYIRLNNCDCSVSNSALQLVANFNLLRLISCCKLMPFDSSERIKKKMCTFKIFSLTTEIMKFRKKKNLIEDCSCNDRHTRKAKQKILLKLYFLPFSVRIALLHSMLLFLFISTSYNVQRQYSYNNANQAIFSTLSVSRRRLRLMKCVRILFDASIITISTYKMA